jgi:iron complex transport system substrate-binding protein
VSPLEFGLWTAGDDTFMNEVAELLGLRNVFGDGPTPIESILSRPGWESITAIKNKAILNLTEDELSRPGPRLALGAAMLYEFAYEGVLPGPDTR